MSSSIAKPPIAGPGRGPRALSGRRCHPAADLPARLVFMKTGVTATRCVESAASARHVMPPIQRTAVISTSGPRKDSDPVTDPAGNLEATATRPAMITRAGNPAAGNDRPGRSPRLARILVGVARDLVSLRRGSLRLPRDALTLIPPPLG